MKVHQVIKEQSWQINIPKIGFKHPKFTFGQVVQCTETNLWGVIIGMVFTPEGMGEIFDEHWYTGWEYQVRLSPNSCSEADFRMTSGIRFFTEEELRLKQ